MLQLYFGVGRLTPSEMQIQSAKFQRTNYITMLKAKTMVFQRTRTYVKQSYHLLYMPGHCFLLIHSTLKRWTKNPQLGLFLHRIQEGLQFRLLHQWKLKKMRGEHNNKNATCRSISFKCTNDVKKVDGRRTWIYMKHRLPSLILEGRPWNFADKFRAPQVFLDDTQVNTPLCMVPVI
jgi:hypothetical protein